MNDAPPSVSYETLQALLEAPQDLVIFALDREYRYLAFNKAHKQTIKAIWGKDVEVGVDMLDFTKAVHDDFVKAKAQFDRALAGEHFVVIDAYGEERLSRRTYRNAYGPLVDQDGTIIGLQCFLSDVTDQVRIAEELEEHRVSLAERNRELAEHADERTKLVEQLRMAVQELSTPVIEVWDDVLALPVIGLMDGRRGSQMIDRLLESVTRLHSQYVILDLTGVSFVDTSSADMFLKLAQAVRMLGAECILCGIQPPVAQTLVELDVQLGLTTVRTLKQALELCMERRAEFASGR